MIVYFVGIIIVIIFITFIGIKSIINCSCDKRDNNNYSEI